MAAQKKQPNEAFAWISTWNNPQKHLDGFQDFDYMTATPEQFVELQLKVIDMFVHASPRARKPETSSIVVACEAGSTFHCHMLFAAKRKIPFTSLQNIYPGIHLEPAFGTWEQCSDYLRKEGSEANEAKAHTKLCEPMSWGTWQYTPKDQMPKQSVFDRINTLLDEGYTPQQMYEMDSKLAYYANAIERTYLSRKKDGIPIVRDITTTYHVGESQQGKSFTLVKLAEQYGYENIHWVSGDYAWIFDGYEYQDILVLDEFRDDKIRFSVLLSILDKYPLKVNVKNSHAYAAYTKVHITSVLAPEQLYIYEDLRKNDTRQQLYNRIHFIVYHWKDADGYHEFEIPFSDYVDYANLVHRAKKSRELQGAQHTPTEEKTRQPSGGQLAVQTLLVKKFYMLAEQAKRFVYEQVCNEIEPEPIAFKKNPFISFDFFPGYYVSTEFDTMAFLESMGQR